MARRQLSVDEARELATREQAGEFDDDPQTKAIARAAIAEAAQRSQGRVIDLAQNTEQEQRALQNVSAGRGIIPAQDLTRRTAGAAQVATTIASSAISEPLAGIAGLAGGLVGLFQGEGFSGPANAVQRAVSDALTFQPRTSTGQEMLEGLAAPLQKLDSGVDYIAERLSGGNPIAATAIYTSLLGGLDVFAFTKAARGVQASNKLVQAQKRIEQIADDLGIDLDPSEFAASIVESAKDMTPAVRNASAEALRDSLRQARELSSASALNKATLAQGSKSFVDVDNTTAFAQQATKELVEEGFDITEMASLNKRLTELQELRTRSPRFGELSAERVTAQIQDVQTIANRIEKQLLSRKDRTNLPRTTRENLALTQLKSKLDNFLDQQFNSDMIKGDPRSIRRWKEAVEARDAHNARFVEDKTIVQLMDRDATPTEISRWLRGTSAAGAKPAASRTVRRIREILGDNHPSVEGIRQDFLFDIAMPLFDQPPDYRAFIRNFDRTMRDQGHLIDALGLDPKNLKQLREFAGQVKNPATKPLFAPDVARAISVFSFGHSLAKKSLLVRGATVPIRMLGRLVFGKNITQKKLLMAELAGANHSVPFMDRFTGPAALAIEQAALSDIVGTLEDQKENDREAVGR